VKRYLAAAAVLAGLAAWVCLGTAAGRANGVPQLVKLTYLDGVSNFGPRDAEGVLEFSFAEAYVRVDVKNLVPQPGMTYESWMTAPGGKTLYVGDLPVNASGLGSYEGKIAKLTSYDYDLFVVAARASGTAAGTLPDKKAIAGRFVVIGANEGTKAGDVRPGLLPDTGQKAGGGLPMSVVAGSFVGVVAAFSVLATIGIVRRGGIRD